MTHPRNAPPAGADAERAAFLRDLRALRDQAGLQTRDLAARAHYPEDTLKSAEDGPALPSLPVLEAYIRGCGARPSDWEDRWRRLTLTQEEELGSALPTRAPTANRLPTRVGAAGPVGLSAAEQAALAPGLARVAAGLGPTTVADTSSWFTRPDATASGPAASAPSGAAPSGAAPSGAGPSGAGPSGAAWPPADRGTAWPPADGATGRPFADNGTARPAAEHGPARPGADNGTAWPAAADNGTAWPAAERGPAWPTAEGGSPFAGQPPRPAPSRTPDATERTPAATGASGNQGRASKPTAPLKGAELPAASQRRGGRRALAGIMLSLAALLIVAALLWLALAS
jgi:hypothetical protein